VFSSLPYLIAGFRLAAGRALVAAVIAEGTDVTYDLKPHRDDPSAVGTQEMAAAICAKMS